MTGEQIDGAAFVFSTLSNTLSNGYAKKMAAIPAVALFILILNHYLLNENKNKNKYISEKN